MEKVLFREEQKYRQPWVWLIIVPAVAGALIYFTWGINQQVIHDKPFGENPLPDAGLIIVAAFSILITVGLTILFYTMKMVTEIRSSGIYFRYPPLMRKFKFISRDAIESYQVRNYKPIKEYGGYGIRVKLKSSGTAYNVRGKIGLQLVLKNGDKILLGTQRKEAIGLAMSKMMRESHEGMGV